MNIPKRKPTKAIIFSIASKRIKCFGFNPSERLV
jgi:hypothetical protein